MTEFQQAEHGSFVKIYVPNLIKATLGWAIFGESGYVLRVNRVEFKKHFQNIDDAEMIADRYVKKQIQKSEFILSIIGDVKE